MDQAIGRGKSKIAFIKLRQDYQKYFWNYNIVLYTVITSSFRQLGMLERSYCYLLISIGVIGGVSSTYSAIKAISSTTTFALPCYIQ